MDNTAITTTTISNMNLLSVVKEFITCPLSNQSYSILCYIYGNGHIFENQYSAISDDAELVQSIVNKVIKEESNYKLCGHGIWLLNKILQSAAIAELCVSDSGVSIHSDYMSTHVATTSSTVGNMNNTNSSSITKLGMVLTALSQPQVIEHITRIAMEHSSCTRCFTLLLDIVHYSTTVTSNSNSNGGTNSSNVLISAQGVTFRDIYEIGKRSVYKQFI